MKKFYLILSFLLIFLSSFAQKISYRELRDIPYSSSKDNYAQERCKLDIYYPENKKNCPTVVWFHGGGLTSGSKSIPGKLKNAGMVVVAVNYRLLPNVSIDTCLDDAATAVAWTFREVEKYGGSQKKIFVSGHSAGGYLTAMIGLDKKWLGKCQVDADSIAGLIPFSGQVISHFSYRKMNGIDNLQPTIDEYAPLFHVRKDASPLVLITGDRNLELFGRYEENAYMWRMMKLVGHVETYLYEIGGHGHGPMGEPAFYILRQHIKRILGQSQDCL
ncbi:alpha/beta hydrolase [Bacteroides muris (ex Fokt et al. 2023)]|uniref:Alpha/beta hydrolase n=1 Tax=Bacteroides muris (ex Fokt et al. 2023) TaxID=2937417 RepID=A0A9X2NW46_9BACE|nr:alpha/beta hydrolase [Bacteroides muris (ex Fokt et al. 2023)]MCR6506141.1 alpha/beta hydrolase [Bacteroides muris (ex Fokt et al. 2023)]